MLEIIALYFLCKKIGEILRGKGRNPIWLQVLTVFFWFGGEIIGAIIGTVFVIITKGEAALDGVNIIVYVFALVGAILGACFSFLIATLMP